MKTFDIPDEINWVKVQSMLPENVELVNYDDKDPNETWIQVRPQQINAVVAKGLPIYIVRFPRPNGTLSIGLRIKVDFNHLIDVI
jgi:hypothetical protein